MRDFDAVPVSRYPYWGLLVLFHLLPIENQLLEARLKTQLANWVVKDYPPFSIDYQHYSYGR
jgi:hypothetical protein